MHSMGIIFDLQGSGGRWTDAESSLSDLGGDADTHDDRATDGWEF
jgi:hypothetical protein